MPHITRPDDRTGLLATTVKERRGTGNDSVYLRELPADCPVTTPASGDTRRRVPVLGSPIDAVTWDAAVGRISRWALARESRFVCMCNVHSVVTAQRDPDFRKVVEGADLAAPDGMPVAWMLRRSGVASQLRINGPDLMLRYCERAAAAGEPVFLLGGRPETLEALADKLREFFPGLVIAGTLSPPFRDLSAEEDDEIVRAINASGAGTVWVGLGCPKQERWMASHRGRIHAVMIGVGAAFEYHSGTIRRAPRWMQSAGLEWAFRLAMEPRRLWKRYLVTNALFVMGAIRQIVFGAG